MNYIDQDLPSRNDIVVVGLSGGVDSTLTALLLKERGCNVIGVTMSLWDGKLPEGMDKSKLVESCYGPGELKNISECEKFCQENQIEYHVIDLTENYRSEVLEYFKSEYRNGHTPNPCVRCNREIKFGALLEGVKKLGIDFDFFCTGHYAKIVRPETGVWESDVRPFMISSALDVSKDQTYFLNRVPSEVLEKVRFPLSKIQKKEVFEMAKERNLLAASRSESQDFIPQEFFDMLFSDKPSIPGDIINLDGKVLGRHRGIEHYTVGQRRGLGVAVNYPVYVHSIDAKNNLVVLAPDSELFSASLIADDMVWPGNVEPINSFEANIKIRLASKPVRAKIEKFESADDVYSGQPYKIIFEKPERAVAPGQSVVMYDDAGVIVGGGIIQKAIK